MSIEGVKGESPKIKEVLSLVKRVAPVNMTVVLQGESGTGKELIARTIHRLSKRSDKPFVAIDCGTLPEALVESELFGYEKGAFTGAAGKKQGQFELAHGGTLFLDEINNIPKSIQMKLLRVIQERKVRHLGSRRDIAVDVRVIAATNTDFREEVKKKRFRTDLYHRLNEFMIEVPPLRERKEDIPPLTRHFLNEANVDLGKNVAGVSGGIMELFLSYAWPGNIRELRNVIRRLVLMTEDGVITKEHLPGEFVVKCGSDSSEGGLFKGDSLSEHIKTITRGMERDIIKKALQDAKNNKTKAAAVLKIDRMTLHAKMKSLGLK